MSRPDESSAEPDRALAAARSFVRSYHDLDIKKRESPKILINILDDLPLVLEFMFGRNTYDSNVVYNLVVKHNRALLSIIGQSNELVQFVDDVLAKEAPRITLARLVTFFSTLTKYNNGIDFSQANFLIKMFKYGGEDFILSFYADMAIGKQADQFVRFMNDNDFISVIINQFEESETIIQLFLALCKNHELQYCCSNSPVFIEFMLETHSMMRWELLSQVITSTNSCHFVSLVLEAIDLISPIQSFYSKLQVSCLLFLKHMFYNIPNLVNQFDIRNLLEIEIDILKRFPNHTIAVSAVFELLVEISNIQECQHIIKLVIFPFVEEVVNKSSGKESIKTACIEYILNLPNYYIDQDDLIPLYTDDIIHFKHIIDDGYGCANPKLIEYESVPSEPPSPTSPWIEIKVK